MSLIKIALTEKTLDRDDSNREDFDGDDSNREGFDRDDSNREE